MQVPPSDPRPSYSPPPSPRLGNIAGVPSAPRNSKLDQIIQNFYTKTTQVILLARLIHYDSPRKINRWFNLELEDIFPDTLKEDLKYWRNTAISNPYPPPPMILELYLDISELAQNQILVIVDDNQRRSRVDLDGIWASSTPGTTHSASAKKSIVLESWNLSLTHPSPPPPLEDLPVVYKKSIIFFRTLYTNVRQLPAYKLYRRMRKTKLTGMRMGWRLVARESRRSDEFAIGVPLIETDARNIITANANFKGVDLPSGSFEFSVTYRLNCEFHIDESEAYESSRFMDMEENYFTPTMAKHRQETERRSGSAGSGGNVTIGEGSGSGGPGGFAGSSSKRLSTTDTGLQNSAGSGDLQAPSGLLVQRRGFSESNARGRDRGEFSSTHTRTASMDDREPHEVVQQRHRLSGVGFGSRPPSMKIGSPPEDAGSLHVSHLSTASTVAGSQPLIRKPSVSLIQPFKAPSLSSSPTSIGMERTSSAASVQTAPPSTGGLSPRRIPSSASLSRTASTPQSSSSTAARPISSTSTTAAIAVSGTPTRSSSSSSQVPQFSSSFDKYRRSASPEREEYRRTRKVSRTSVYSFDDGRESSSSLEPSSLSPIVVDSTSDEANIADFMKELDMSSRAFNGHSSGGSSRIESPSFQIGSPSFGNDSMSGSALNSSVYKSKIQLSKFRAVRNDMNSLTESVSASTVLEKPPPLSIPSPLSAASPVSSTSTTSSKPYQPAIPSPLHNTKMDYGEPNTARPMRIPQETGSTQQRLSRDRRSIGSQGSRGSSIESFPPKRNSIGSTGDASTDSNFPATGVFDDEPSPPVGYVSTSLSPATRSRDHPQSPTYATRSGRRHSSGSGSILSTGRGGSPNALPLASSQSSNTADFPKRNLNSNSYNRYGGEDDLLFDMSELNQESSHSTTSTAPPFAITTKNNTPVPTPLPAFARITASPTTYSADVPISASGEQMLRTSSQPGMVTVPEEEERSITPEDSGSGSSGSRSPGSSLYRSGLGRDSDVPQDGSESNEAMNSMNMYAKDW